MMTLAPSRREIVGLAFKYKKRLLSVLAVPPLLAAAALAVLPAQYEAQAKLLVAGSAQDQNAELNMLTSRDLSIKALQNIGMLTAYPDLPRTRPGDPVAEAGAERMRADLTARADPGSPVIEIGYRNADRHIAQAVLQRLAAAYVDRHQHIFQASDIRLLEQQIKDTNDRRAALTVAQEKAAERSQGPLAQASRADVLKARETAAKALADTTRQRAELGHQIDFLKDAARNQPVLTQRGSDAHPSDSQEALKRHLAELKEKEARLDALYQPGMPLIAANKREIAATETVLAKSGEPEQLPHIGPNPIRDQIDAALISAQSSVPPLDARITALQNDVASATAQLQDFKGQTALDNLDGQMAALQAEAQALQDALVKARVNDDLSRAGGGSVTIIEQPNVSSMPSYPNRLIWMSSALALGFAAGCLTLWRLASSKTFVGIESVERLLGLPVLTAVPEIPFLIAPPKPGAIGHRSMRRRLRAPKRISSRS